MSSSSSSRLRAVAAAALLAAALALAGGALAQESLRPEVGQPLQAAQELIKARQVPRGARQGSRGRGGRRHATPTRRYLIERMRLAAASGAGDADTAARSFEALSSSSRITGPDKLRMIESIAGSYYRAQQYAKAMQWSQRYLREGGTSAAIRTMLIQSQYLSGDFAGAIKELTAEIQAAERSRHAAARGSPEAAAQRGVEAERQQRLRVRDGEAGHLLPEEGVLGRPAEPHAAQAELLGPALARHLSALARHRQHVGTGRLHGDGAARAPGRLWPAKASRSSTRVSAAVRSSTGAQADRAKRLKR